MTKAEFIEKLISKSPDLPATDVALAVNNLFEQMSSALEKGERIEIRGFGSFSVRQMKARQGRNPKTGEVVQVKPHAAIHFKPGVEMRERVNNRQYAITDT